MIIHERFAKFAVGDLPKPKPEETEAIILNAIERILADAVAPLVEALEEQARLTAYYNGQSDGDKPDPNDSSQPLWKHYLSPKAEAALVGATTEGIPREAENVNCPFCKGLGVLLETHDFPRRQKVWIQCNECGAQGPRFPYYDGDKLGSDKAWEAWRKRAMNTDEWHPASEPPKPGDFEPTGLVEMIDTKDPDFIVEHYNKWAVRKYGKRCTHWRKITPPK